MAHASATETLKVKAGDKIEMAHQRIEPSLWEDNQWYGCPDNRGTCHPQWVQVCGNYSERTRRRRGERKRRRRRIG
jgi:hypothetical protein